MTDLTIKEFITKYCVVAEKSNGCPCLANIEEFTAYSSLTELVEGLIDFKEFDASENDILTVRKCFINHFRRLLETKTSYKTEIVNFNDGTYLRIYKNE